MKDSRKCALRRGTEVGKRGRGGEAEGAAATCSGEWETSLEARRSAIAGGSVGIGGRDDENVKPGGGWTVT